MKSKAQTPTASLVAALRKPDLSILGNAIRSLPPAQWTERMFFTGAADTELREQTGSFPATLRQDKTTHPIFLLRAGTSGHAACPCSTKGHWRKFRYIREGCRLEMKEHTMDRDSFLIERYPFTLPLDHRLFKQVRFCGRVPMGCLIDRRVPAR